MWKSGDEREHSISALFIPSNPVRTIAKSRQSTIPSSFSAECGFGVCAVLTFFRLTILDCRNEMTRYGVRSCVCVSPVPAYSRDTRFRLLCG